MLTRSSPSPYSTSTVVCGWISSGRFTGLAWIGNRMVINPVVARHHLVVGRRPNEVGLVDGDKSVRALKHTNESFTFYRRVGRRSATHRGGPASAVFHRPVV